MDCIEVTEWGEEQFQKSRDEWTELLGKSASDSLFMSWEWLFTWWSVFCNPDEMKLRLFVATDSDGKLVGIAPLYLSVVKLKTIFKTRRLEFVGNRWRGPATMPTELLDFIVDKSVSDRVVRAFFAHIFALPDWDEFILSGLNKSSKTCQLLISEKLLHNSYLRYAEEFESYYLNMTGTFSQYIQKLGKNTRLRLYNRRKLLDTLGDVKYELTEPHNIDEQFKLLNELHAKRWGQPVFKGKRLEFNKRVANLLAQKSALAFSMLSVNDNPVSVQYNYIVNGHEYNIQAGFDESFHRNIALGYLHFGYAIEHAYLSGVTTYDFLAGEGKNSQYKAKLTKTSLSMVDIQVIRNIFFKALYRIYDRFQGA